MKKELTKEEKEQIFRVRKIREDAGYSQERFADILGISTSAYKKIESHEHRISLENLNKIHKKFLVSTDYILFGERDGVNDVWEIVLNCTGKDKFAIFLRLYEYLFHGKNEIYPKADEQQKDMEKILSSIEEILSVEKKDGV